MGPEAHTPASPSSKEGTPGQAPGALAPFGSGVSKCASQEQATRDVDEPVLVRRGADLRQLEPGPHCAQDSAPARPGYQELDAGLAAVYTDNEDCDPENGAGWKRSTYICSSVQLGWYTKGPCRPKHRST